MDSRNLVLNRLVEMESIIAQMRKDLEVDPEKKFHYSLEYCFKRAWDRMVDFKIIVEETERLLEQDKSFR